MVLVPAGAAAEVQGVGVLYLGFLAVLSGAGRALGAAVVYWLADKLEDLLLGKNRKLFGYSHADVEKLGARLSGTRRDWWVLFLLNVFPAMPPVLPIACGFLKVRFFMFLSATFLGNIISALPLLAAGYAGVQIAAAVSRLELYTQIILGALVVAVLAWAVYYYKTKRRLPKG